MKVADHCDRCRRPRTPADAIGSFDAVMALDAQELKRVKTWLRRQPDGKQSLCPKCIRELADGGS